MPPEPTVTQLSPTTTAYLQLPGGWFLNNAGWITGEDRTLLVDTCATEALSNRLLSHVPAGPALTAVITHAHGDHANGARLVADAGGRVLASAHAAKEIEAGPHIYPTLFSCADSTWGEITPPKVSPLEEATEIDLGGVTAELIPVAEKAHTGGDVVVWLPAEGILFTGDLLFAGGITPLAVHGSIQGWVEALEWLTTFEARYLVPGHGPIAESTALNEEAAYLRWLLKIAEISGVPAFAEWEKQARELWPDWLEAERHAVNLRLAHAEVHGYEFDPIAALTAMLLSAGGNPIDLDATLRI